MVGAPGPVVVAEIETAAVAGDWSRGASAVWVGTARDDCVPAHEVADANPAPTTRHSGAQDTVRRRCLRSWAGSGEG